MAQEDDEIIQSTDGHAFEAFKTRPCPIQECVLPLLARAGNNVWPIGTAFAIHPYGLLVTARHVVEEAASHAEPRTRSDGTSYEHYELLALYVNSSRSSASELFGGPLPVLKVWCSESQDIAVLHVSVPVNVETGEPLQLRCAILGTRPPRKGNPIAAVGYHKMSVGALDDGSIEYEQETAISTGTVTEVFHERRDRVLGTYPCFHVDARFDPGMSGGPIFDDRNRVCGIVSRGVSLIDGEHAGLGASIWPALAIPIEPNLDGKVEKTTLLELARRSLISLDEREAPIEIVDGTVRIRYSSSEWAIPDPV